MVDPTAAENPDTVFVSVAAFCDPQLMFTVNSLFSAASRPDRVFAAIIDQHPHSQRERFSAHPQAAQIRYLHIDPVDSRGVSWARSLAFSLYRGETWFLQVDSHTWFRPGWDEQLIQRSRALEASYPKPLLTCYPPGFHFGDDGQPVADLQTSNDVMAFTPLHDAAFTRSKLICAFQTRWVNGPDHVSGFHVAGGFIFARGRFIEEVPYDPYMYFSGEEQNIAIRAWTRGWDLVHPRMSEVPLSHLYKRAGISHDEHHWRQDLESRRTEKWPALQARAHERFCRLVRGELAGSAYGLGSARTLTAFAEFSGLDYPNCRVRRTPPMAHETARRLDMGTFGRVAIRTDLGDFTSFANDAWLSMALEAHRSVHRIELGYLFKDVRSDAVVVQAGGFIGYQSALMARHLQAGGHLTVFEPQPQLFELLQENLASQPSEARVEVRAEALWDAPGRGEMPMLATQARANHAYHRVVPQGGGQGELNGAADAGAPTATQIPAAWPVMAITLDSLAFERLDVLHIDVGFDSARVLAGALQTIRRCGTRVMIDYTTDNQREIEAVLPLLKDYRMQLIQYPVHPGKKADESAGLIPADFTRSVLLLTPQPL